MNQNDDQRSTNNSDQNNNNDPFANKKGIRLSDYWVKYINFLSKIYN